MENIFTQIVSTTDLPDLLLKILRSKYQLAENIIQESIANVQSYLQHLRDDLTIVVEYPYVDKVYRNTYYHYYASKLEHYSRFCIRLSFFKSPVTKGDFRSAAQIAYLQKEFAGFLVLRPTFPSVIGRSHLSASATTNANIETCSVSISTTVEGVKLTAVGFPHASQDQEMLTCAETTIWSLMEYFSNRYADYQPALPDKISKVLNSISFERLLPSKGLSGNQISFAVKEFGFGVRAYANSQYGNGFEPLLATYVESGIPVIALIENDQGIGHTINIIGRESYNRHHIDSLQQTNTLAGGNEVYDFATMPMQYVMVDDNFPPYQLAYLNNPVSYYHNPKWVGCIISSFVVPLYSKIYLEAGEARQMALQILNLVPFAHTEAIVVKTFLASSRSFKHSLALNNLLDPTAKELLVNTSMPKFVWITEITTKALLEQHLCTGLIVADATEPFRMGVIACLAEDIYLTFTHTNITQAVLPLPPFTMYHHNLKIH